MAEIPAVLKRVTSEPIRPVIVGASGFVGRALTALAAERGLAGSAVSRSGGASGQGGLRTVKVASYEDREAMAAAAAGSDVAILLAARAHVLDESARDPEAAFLQANRDLPVAVAEALASAGGRRLVFVSSVAVNGTKTAGRPFQDGDRPAPVNAYGRSKLAGEEALAGRCAALGLELVVIRPPLVYGPGAPGNFGRLLRMVERGVPLPFGMVGNRRDLIGLDNLADLLLLAAAHPAAAGETFLVSDGEAISTAALVARLSRAAGRRGRLVPVPPAILRAAAWAAGKGAALAPLLDDLAIDATRARALLGWRPPVSLDEGLGRCVAGEAPR